MPTDTADLHVGNLMTADPVVIGPDTPASEAESLLRHIASAASRSCGMER